MRRLRGVLNRLAMAGAVLVCVSALTFVVARLVPSDPAAAWVGPRATAERIAAAREELGLDRPLHEQYLRYVGALLRADLGTSVKTHRPIATDIELFLPATLELVGAAMLVAMLLGVPAGAWCAANRGGRLDHLLRVVSVAGVSLPTFWLALLLQMVFFRWLGLLPLGGRLSTEVALLAPVPTRTGLLLVDAAVSGNWVAFWDALRHLILPAMSASTYAVAVAIRMTRATMIEVLGSRYILAARAAGISERRVLFVLALRNALVPTLTVLGLAFVYSLTGAVLVEVVFAWPGLGAYVTDAVLSVDFPVVVSVTLVVTAFYVVVNLLVDVVQTLIDPRVSLDGAGGATGP